MKVVEGTTVIGASVTIRGEIAGSEDVLIEGQLVGTLRSPGSRISIAASAKVRGDLVAQEVIVAGRLEGSIWATGRVDLRAGAIVLGDIFAGQLSVEQDAILKGHVDPSRAHEVPREPVPQREAERTPTMISGQARPAIVPAHSDSSEAGNAGRTAQLPAGLAAATALISRNSSAEMPASAEPGHGGHSDEVDDPDSLFAETEA